MRYAHASRHHSSSPPSWLMYIFTALSIPPSHWYLPLVKVEVFVVSMWSAALLPLVVWYTVRLGEVSTGCPALFIHVSGCVRLSIYIYSICCVYFNHQTTHTLSSVYMLQAEGGEGDCATYSSNLRHKAGRVGPTQSVLAFQFLLQGATVGRCTVWICSTRKHVYQTNHGLVSYVCVLNLSNHIIGIAHAKVMLVDNCQYMNSTQYCNINFSVVQLY